VTWLTWMLASNKIMHTFGEAEEKVLLQVKEQWEVASSETVALIPVIDMEKAPSQSAVPRYGPCVPPKRGAHVVLGGLTMPSLLQGILLPL
jgi:hypothetical protein